MEKKDDRLRRTAEEILLKTPELMADNASAESPEDIQPTRHELQVHQIELEMQNDELRRTQEELYDARARYFDLYDLAPVGYCIISETGLILETNLTAASLLGVVRGALTGKPISRFVLKEDQDAYYLYRKHLSDTAKPQVCELRMVKHDGTVFWAHLAATSAQDTAGLPKYRIVLSDITSLKNSETKLNDAQMELQRFNEQLLSSEKDLKRQNGLFSSLLKLLPMGVFMVEAPSGKPLVANEQACLLLGRGILPDATGHNLSEVYKAHKAGSSDPYPPEEMPILRGMQGESSYTDDMVVVRPDGTETLLEIFGTPVADDQGHIWANLVSFRDITGRSRMETALAQDKRLLETTLKSVGDGVISTDNRGNIAFMNLVAEYLTGWTLKEASGKPIGEVFNLVHGQSLEKYEDMAQGLLENDKTLKSTSEFLLVSKDGTARPIEETASPILHENGEIAGAVLVFRDFSEKKLKQEEIEYLSYHDQLTGLYNRRFYEEELKRLDVPRNLPLTIAMGDVNGLKLINDSFGHIIGDELLQKAAEVIKVGCRADDIIARLGGDEFVIILPKTGFEETKRILQRIGSLIKSENAGSINLSVSFGSDTKENKEESIQKTFKNAEDKMYRNKLNESSRMRRKTIDLIMNTLYEKNNREMLHSIRVSKICEDIGTRMGFDKDDIVQIRLAGLMHDIGKIGVDEKILNKIGELDPAEWTEIKKHSEIGYRILSSVNEFSEIADYILEHHERWDGKGYPRGLKDEEISLRARIIAVADAYEAMTAEKVYGKTLGKDEVIAEIRRCAGTQFDPAIASRFIEEILLKDPG